MFSLAMTLVPILGGFLGGLGVVLLYIMFFVSSILLIVIILLQEGKGGGFAAAFGGMGTEAFGVKAGGINKFTGVLAGIFIATALVLGVATKSGETVATDLETELTPGATPSGGQTEPGSGTSGEPGAGQAPPAGTAPATPPASPGGTPPAPAEEKGGDNPAPAKTEPDPGKG